jgi:tripartite-type tricarboxylate transporter receptor subunit TctC
VSLYKNLSYDTLRDFVAVSMFSQSPNILVVNSSSPAKSVSELIALARAKPGTLNYSSAGAGTTQHLAGELLKLRTGTNIVHVAYKGSAPSLTALIAGDVDFSFANIPAILQHVKSGRLRPLASTGTRRSELMPDVPTMREAGLGVEGAVWYGVFAPAATPREIVITLSDAIKKATRSTDLKQRLLDQGEEPVGNAPAEFDLVVRKEVAKWGEVIRTSGIQVE